MGIYLNGATTARPEETLLNNNPNKELTMSDANNRTTTWPELAIGLYDRLTGRQAEIAYEFDGFELDVPSSATPDATHAHWKLNGTLRVSMRDHAHAS